MTAYRVDAAPAGQWCQHWHHDERRIPAVVVTEDELYWCRLHWHALAERLRREGYRIDPTPAARAALGVGGRE